MSKTKTMKIRNDSTVPFSVHGVGILEPGVETEVPFEIGQNLKKHPQLTEPQVKSSAKKVNDKTPAEGGE